MTKKEYNEILLKNREKINALNKEVAEAKKQYILDCAPCEKDVLVEIVLDSGRVVSGEAKIFGIFQDGDVYVTGYKCAKDKKMHYISKPYKKIEKL